VVEPIELEVDDSSHIGGEAELGGGHIVYIPAG